MFSVMEPKADKLTDLFHHLASAFAAFKSGGTFVFTTDNHTIANLPCFMWRPEFACQLDSTVFCTCTYARNMINTIMQLTSSCPASHRRVSYKGMAMNPIFTILMVYNFFGWPDPIRSPSTTLLLLTHLHATYRWRVVRLTRFTLRSLVAVIERVEFLKFYLWQKLKTLFIDLIIWMYGVKHLGSRRWYY